MYAVHKVAGSTHPAPLVTHPVKKVLQSALVVRVLAAYEQAFAIHGVVATDGAEICQHVCGFPPDFAVVIAPQLA